jgi:fumarylpyruvate hydrolase
MNEYLFEPARTPGLPVRGVSGLYPVNRIFCVGRNYAAHAAEMGFKADHEAPFYFTKTPAMAVVMSGATIPYPPGTDNFHHEVELVVALGAPVFRAGRDEAAAAIYAYGVGLDMTRRDRQFEQRDKGRPWTLGKDIENGAVLTALTPAAALGAIGPQRIHLDVDGERRQDARLSELIFKVDEVISHLSHFYHLRPGDLIMTGTPAGVGPVGPGQTLRGGIDGLGSIELTLGAPDA